MPCTVMMERQRWVGHAVQLKDNRVRQVKIKENSNFPLYSLEARLVTPTNMWKKARHARAMHSTRETRTNISQALIISGTTNSGPLSCE